MPIADRWDADPDAKEADGVGHRRGLQPSDLGPCAAPVGALYFQPDGRIYPCCGSSQILGAVTGPRRGSLMDIWNGEPARALREAVAAGDLRRGCDECAPHLADGRRDDSLASHFDHIVPVLDDDGFPVFMDFALSSTCNLQCVMCNGELSSAIRTQREGRPRRPSAYDQRFFAELREFLPHLRFAVFKGGEPFLAREVRQVWDDLRELAPDCKVSVTTNGTQMSPMVEQYVRDLRMHVVVSIDGATAEANEAIRVGTDHDQVLANIARFVELTDEVGSSVSLSFCLMASNWGELPGLLDLADELDVDVSVIWVNQPHRFDLLALGRAALEDVRHQLGLEDRPARFGRHAPTWSAVLERLDDRLGQSTITPVSVGLRAHPGGLAPLAEELRRWSGVEPVVVRCDGDVVGEVRAPAWAGWMEAGSWIGHARSEILALMWEVTASTASYEMHQRADGVEDVSITLNGGAWEGGLRALLTSDERGSAVLLAPIPEADCSGT